MKKIWFSLLIFSCSFISAQNAGIFYYAIQLDEDLITFRQKIDSDRKVLTQTSDRVSISENLIDSIRLQTKLLMAEYLSAELRFIEKKSKSIVSAALPVGMVEGLPFQGLKKAQKIEPNLDFYVKIYIQFKEKASLTVSSRKSDDDSRYLEKWLLKPEVKVQLKVFDSSGKSIDSMKSKFSDLPSLKKKVLNWEEKQFSRTTALSGYDIYYYSIQALQRLIKTDN